MLFDLGNLGEWVGLADPARFSPLVRGEVRSMFFNVILGNGAICTVKTDDGDMAVVAAGDGLHEVRFTLSEPVSIAITGPKGAVGNARFYDEPQYTPEPLEPSFTSVEPRKRGPNDEVRRLMHLQAVNMKRREAAMAETAAALKAQQDRLAADLIELEAAKATKDEGKADGRDNAS